MGIGSFLKGLVDSRQTGRNIISTFEQAYRKAQDVLPGAEPHILLTQVYLSRVAVQGRDTSTEIIQTAAMHVTARFACIPPPANVRALAIHFIQEERPDIFNSYPEFILEYNSLMLPVDQAIMRDELDALYRSYNPNIAGEDSTAR